MTAATDHLGTLRGALSGWLYDPRHTTASHEAQAAHADAIESALAECKREGLGDVGRDLSRGHGWEDTAACWVWRLPRWDDHTSSIFDAFEIEDFVSIKFKLFFRCRWFCEDIKIDWWSNEYNVSKDLKWSVGTQYSVSPICLKSPEGLALLDTVRPKVTL